MRNNHARELAERAVVVCYLCEWFTPFSGSKAEITARLKAHLRQDHTEKEYLDQVRK